MKSSVLPSSLRPFSHTNRWIWATIILAALSSGIVSLLHIQHQRDMQLTRIKLESLRIARIDLNKGFLYISLSGAADSPFSREQGLVLLEQALQTFAANLDLLGTEQTQSAETFRRTSELFQKALQDWNGTTSSQASKAATMRVLFNDLERQADQIDHHAEQIIQELDLRLETEFEIVMLVDMLLLAGVCIVVIFTEQIKSKSETALRKSETKFHNLFENKHTPMMLINPLDRAILDANEAACNFYGWSRAEILQKHVDEINTLSADEILKEMESAVREKRTYFQFKHRLANGDIRDVEIFSGPVEIDGKILLFSIVHDISQLKKAERAVLENEIRMKFALEGANDGFWDLQIQTDALFLSPRGCEILGYTAEEFGLTGSGWLDMINQEDMPGIELSLDAHTAGQSPIFEREMRLRMKSGEWKWVLVRGKLVERDPQGNPSRMTGTFTDITSRRQFQERNEVVQMQLQELLAEADESRQVLLSVVEDQKLAEEKLTWLNAELEQRVGERTAQLLAANKELESFSYSVSHDLRAPLRGIDGWSLALMEDYQDQLDEKGRQYINRVRSETQRMGHLIDDLLRLSRVTRVEMKRSQVNLSELAQTICTRLEDDKDQQPVSITIQPNMLDNADPNLLEILLTNLLSNAYKFTGKKPDARIEFGKTIIENYPTYFIRDNGDGFDMEYAKNLFGAFQRLHRQSEFPGTGIGLATVQRIVFRHGGRVWADAHKNLGATFYFTLGAAE